MPFEDTIKFLSKKGVNNTFQILSTFKGYKAEMREFYEELRKFSYYNSFFRVKDWLLGKGLIKIHKLKGKKHISLTQKGITVYEKLIEINSLLSS